jgi:hypothetical protein
LPHLNLPLRLLILLQPDRTYDHGISDLNISEKL